ncbi:type II toxin-antitoxin system RelE/ParE family toxin [Dietzia sp. PP-33]|uniref:type II toxin-antitoxin system RelE family toxin n=1 Tax=Dietzia sp. PP-33 TaxID=2957500 RepID=UPI00299FD2EE|nr:type II toxin-antitoxin system RelE/ParE family toxin [Dietzia sp. PP-33]MDX2355962.1 type II toxin-antitoxin system RelE/ParE family toxin [Dietzia sp. PP-33]
MAYLVEVTPHVQKVITTLGRQDKTAQQGIRAILDERIHGCEDPRYLGKALRGDQHLWRYRVGDYRIIFSIENQRVTVLVVDVAHRRELYR